MVMHFIKGFLLLIALLLNNALFAQDSICKLVREYAIAFKTDTNYNQYVLLRPYLRNVELLALGENTHGTHEFFTTKAAIIKYGVTAMFYKHIGIEADFAGTEVANQYIQTGEGNVNDVVYQMGISAWMTAEMKDLLNWLKQYNQGKEEAEKVHLFGFDRQFVATALGELKKRLNTLQYNGFEKYNRDNLIQLNEEQLKQLRDSLVLYTRTLKQQEEEQVMALYEALTIALKYNQIKDSYQKANYRDKAMYDCIKTYHQQHKGKIILWAHNEHITSKGNVGIWKTMGERLKSEFNESYYAIGLMTHDGYLGFYNRYTQLPDSMPIPQQAKKTFESAFAACGTPCFFVELRPVRANSLNPFVERLFTRYISTIDLSLNTKTKEYSVTNHYFKSNITQKFDGIIFIKTTSAARH